MVAYSFKSQFVAPITDGTKAQTIRADRKRHAHVGEELQLYTGMRTRSCRLIGCATCTAITPIRIRLDGEITLGERRVVDLDAFARSDGFRDWQEMRAFWAANRGADGFSGVLIAWTRFRAAPRRAELSHG